MKEPIRYKEFIDHPFNDWQEIDIIVSRDCTLRCKYCYLQKHPDGPYDLEAVMRSVRQVVGEAAKQNKEGVIFSFYPEPWVNVDRSNTLISRTLEILLDYPQYVDHFMIMLGTNGVNLHKRIPIVEKFRDRLSLAVTIDGVKEQHDMYRVFPDGSPSWDIVKKNILRDQDHYSIRSTKVTLGPDTLKYLYETSLFLWEEMGFYDIYMNVVFENLWGPEEEKRKSLEIFEEQLELLYDDIIKNRRWENMQYQSIIGSQYLPDSFSLTDISEENKTFCGATQMRSIDSDGRIYPCFRLSPYSLGGNDFFHITPENQKIRSLKLLQNYDAFPQRCKECDTKTACSMCVGGAYEETNSLFGRTTYHCEFIKIQAKYAERLYKEINKDNV